MIYAINYTFAKDVMPEYILPSGFILLRVFGAVFLFSFSYFFVRERIAFKDLLYFAICGLFGVAINQLLFFNGLNLTTPINAAIVMTINPILVIVFSFIILRESTSIKQIFGVIFGIAGATILILKSGNISLSTSSNIGNLFVLLNATSYALYLVIVKPLMKKYHPITVMFYVFGFGLLYVFPFGYIELFSVDWSAITNFIFFQIFFVVIFTTFIAYLCNAIALKYLKPTTVSVYIYLQPILAALFAVFWGSDFLDSQKIISSLLIFTGVYLVSSGRVKPKP